MLKMTRDLQPVLENIIRQMAAEARGSIDHLFLHWSAGHYGQAYTDYHLCIDQDGKIYDMTDDNGFLENPVKCHTWHRNTGSIGIALLCGAGAVANSGYDADLGDEPPTAEQIEAMSKIIAVICDGLGLEINYGTVETHQEAAAMDGYGPGSGDPETRWDLWFLPDGGQMVYGGNLLRSKAAWYQQNS